MSNTRTAVPSWYKSAPFRARKWLRTHRATISAVAIGFLAGVAANVATNPAVDSFAAFRSALSRPLFHPLTLLLVSALVALALVWLGEYGLGRYCNRRRWEVLLAAMARNHTGASIASFASSSLAWGDCLSLQTSPDLQRGWKPSDIQIQWTAGTRELVLDKTEQDLYQAFREANRDKKWYANDCRSVRLVKNPVAFTDTPNLILEVQECKYSQVRYTNEVLAKLTATRQPLLQQTIQGQLNFAHTLVLHAVVITNDGKYLATLSSPKKDFFGNTWSLSIEEQLKPDDLEGKEPNEVFLSWVQRAVREEIGVAAEDLPEERISVLSVFIEGHNLNTGLCLVIQLGLSEAEVSAMIRAKARADYEFVDFRFWTLQELASILRNPEGWQLHPTTCYRIFLTLTHQLDPVRAGQIIASGGVH